MWQRNYNQHSSAKHAQQKTLLFACFFVLLVSSIQVSETAGAVSLPAYNVNINRTSVSGLSAGGFMAVQMNVAFSSIMIGAGVFAGGPYNCAQGDLSKAQINCMYAVPAPSVSDSIQITNSRSKSGSIDDVSNLANQQIYIFSGTKDTTVKQAVSDVLNEYYLNYVTTGSVVYDDSLAAAHTFPTNNQIGNGCGVSASPYISYCQYDGAGYALNHIFNYTLNPRSDLLTGEMIAFDQTEFYNRDMKTAGMDDVGYLYVPKACSLGASCSLHIALHGCLQAYENVGDDFIYYAGYNEWAETNNLIILYPQSVSSLTNPSNPNACWDWWGYTNPNTYDIQSGVQMQILKSMIDRISSQYADYLDAPTLSLSNVDDTSVTLQWNDVENAFGYYVYRNDDLVTASPVEDTQYTDNGLSSGSKYVYNVAAVASTGQQGPLSSSLTVSTTGNPPPLTPPSSLTAEEVTSSTIILAWSYVSGAEKYNVYRNGNFVGSSSENGYSDGYLQASTTYTYTVNAENSSGVSDLSNSLAVTTASSFECTSHTTNNYQHVVAGRAYAKLGIAYASGSDDYMGLYNIFVYTTLSETSLEYFVVGSC